MSEKIEIKPIKTKEYSVKQSKYDVCGKLPIRSVILGPSGSGKTVLLQNMILNLYKGCFERIYVFSPSVNHDTTWLSVKEYVEDVLFFFLKKKIIKSKDCYILINRNKKNVYVQHLLQESKNFKKINKLKFKLLSTIENNTLKKLNIVLISA